MRRFTEVKRPYGKNDLFLGPSVCWDITQHRDN